MAARHNTAKGPGQGPARGRGNGSPPHALDTSPAKQKARAAKSVTLRERMRAWRREQEETLGKSLEKPRPLSLPEVREMAKSYAPDAFDALADVVRDDRCSAAARVAAATALLDRGYGKPVQQIQQLDRKGDPTDPATVNLAVLAFEKLSDDELDVMIALYRKMGIRPPWEPPAAPDHE